MKPQVVVIGNIGIDTNIFLSGRLDLSHEVNLTENLEIVGQAGGFATETKYYQVTERAISGVSPVAWGEMRNNKMNEFLTVRALSVLKHAGRLEVDSYEFSGASS